MVYVVIFMSICNVIQGKLVYNKIIYRMIVIDG